MACRRRSVEPTATPEKYIVYTRIGNGAFDSAHSYRHFIHEKYNTHSIYSFKVTAVNSERKFPLRNGVALSLLAKKGTSCY